MRLALAQLNPCVGGVADNVEGVLDAYKQAVAAGADLVAAGELALTGYPPEDLVLKRGFVRAVGAALLELAAAVGEVPLVVGFVEDLRDVPPERWRPVATEASEHPPLANAAAVLRDGRVEVVYRKQRIPNYGVFDEARYFAAGHDAVVIEVASTRVGIIICEDLWEEGGPAQQSARVGAEVVLCVNASPYHRGKRVLRETWARRHARASGVWIAYVNQVGGQDEVVFDGDSFIVAPDGAVVARGRQFAPDLVLADVPGHRDEPAPRLEPAAEVYAALVLGTGDYVRKNGFTGALLGVSGGIDSALVAAVAVDALGGDAVTGVGMPSPWSSPGSVTDARDLCERLGVRWLELPISGTMAAFSAALAEPFAGTEPGVAEENLQARIRGTLLMALSNKFGDIVLATGNKSEFAVGYATLYGDMAGGFAPLKDVSKTLVYALCAYRNALGEVIPRAILDKPPSAELRPDQRDTDSLPPYDLLDPIIEAYVERYLGVREIVAEGNDLATVRRVVRLVDRAEYKRRQAPPGTKVTTRAFGRDRRLPITQVWSG